MKLKITSLDQKAAGEITLNQDIFGAEVREDILHRVVRWQLANRQAGTHRTKQKNDINKTTKKPFKQKGTGNARQGDLKGPHMRGGYKAHGPVVRSHAVDLPKKIRKLGLKSALSYKVREGQISIVKDAAMKAPKTAELGKLLSAFHPKSVLVIDGEAVDANFKKAIANLAYYDVLPTQGANVYDILRHEHLLITEEGVKALEKRLS